MAPDACDPLRGVPATQLMARHKSNHITVSYAPDSDSALEIMVAKASMAAALGYRVFICGDVFKEASLEFKAAQGLPVEGPYES